MHLASHWGTMEGRDWWVEERDKVVECSGHKGRGEGIARPAMRACVCKGGRVSEGSRVGGVCRVR
jgi:hypothetical protein